ncbi:glycosyltransferase family 9 protein [Pollutimonas subterranea]|nr:glycosyltransferase family 9 protein [Pollutimonas subterranea]
MMTEAGIWSPIPRSIAIFRALNLGDLLCTIPALRALRLSLPGTRITLIGLASAIPVVERFNSYVNELLLFPGDPAFPEQAARMDELPEFYRRVRDSDFDLILQMHGSGAQSNQIVQRMGARRWAGFVPEASQQEPGRLMTWPHHLPEVHRYLALLSYLGLPASDDALEFPLSDDDHREADAAATHAGVDLDRTIFIHPGARMPSRRWPLDRFADVMQRLAGEGWQLAVTGSPDETELAASLIHRARVPAANFSGKTSLGGLVGLLQRGRMVICNDTGISHLAAAVRLPSVVIASGSDVARWAPLDAGLHRVLHAPTPCRPCSYFQCPIGHPCALGVSVDQVMEEAQSQLGAIHE